MIATVTAVLMKLIYNTVINTAVKAFAYWRAVPEAATQQNSTAVGEALRQKRTGTG